MIADQEYPVRPAFSLLTKLLDDFIAKVPQSSFNTPAAISFPEVNTYLQKYQDPRQADAIMKVQQELDETKIILVRRASCCTVQPTDSTCLWCTAQDDRVSAAARREDQRLGRPLERALDAEQDVLQDGEEGASSSTILPCVCLDRLPLQQNSCCVIM